MNNELNTLTGKYLPAIDTEMRTVLHELEGMSDPADVFYGMIHYHMGWRDETLRPMSFNTGKRIRPLLTLLINDAAGGDWHQAVPAASAIEIIHNFSLVHDDIQDASETRRGRETLWRLWGEPLAINTGDAMFAMAHLGLNRLIDQKVPADIVVRAFRRFDETCVQLTQGQFADMSFESRENVSTDEYLTMIAGKTAVLIALSAELGAMVAGADDEKIAHYKAFGRDLGLGFQIEDDILGIWGDESMTGKSAASDIITRKKSLPVLYGLAKSADLRKLYAQTMDEREFVPQAVAELSQTGAREYAADLAAQYSNSALGHLEAVEPAGNAGVALFQLADMLLGRDA